MLHMVHFAFETGKGDLAYHAGICPCELEWPHPYPEPGSAICLDPEHFATVSPATLRRLEDERRRR